MRHLPNGTYTAGKRPSKDVNPDHCFSGQIPLLHGESQNLGFLDGPILSSEGKMEHRRGDRHMLEVMEFERSSVWSGKENL